MTGIVEAGKEGLPCVCAQDLALTAGLIECTLGGWETVRGNSVNHVGFEPSVSSN